MKFLKSSVAMLAVVAISACSKGPSASDAKQAVQDALGNCSYLSLDSFDKTNGIPVGDQEYRVEVKYSVKMMPIAENKKAVDEAVSALSNVDAELVKAEAGIKKYSDDRATYLQTHEGSSSFQYEVDSKSQYDEYQKSLASSETNRELKSNGPGRVKAILQTNLLKECPAVNRNLMISFFTPEISIARYSDDIVSDFTETIPMIKTDNGWQRRRQ